MAGTEKQLLAIDPTTVKPGRIVRQYEQIFKVCPLAQDRRGRWYFCNGLATDVLITLDNLGGSFKRVNKDPDLLARAKAAYDKIYEDQRGRVVLGLAVEASGPKVQDLNYPWDDLGVWIMIGKEDGLEKAEVRRELDGGADFMYVDVKKIRAGEEQGSKDVAASYKASARGPWGCQVRGCEPEHRRW